jgi:geranylgeranyl diphosphate synthase type II
LGGLTEAREPAARRRASAGAESQLRRLSQPARPVEELLARWIDERPLPASLREAIRYAVLSPGKRMRPLLVLHACHAVGGRMEDAWVPAAAVELVHAFSLVHDDLPSMDDDDLRRGRPTLHRHTSEAMALLAGDAMLGLAFELVLTRAAPAGLAARLAAELAAGANDLVAGQVYDTVPGAVDGGTALERLELIHRHKTGALIRASCRLGGLAGGGAPWQIAALTSYGEAVGHMFQVVDDLLDVTRTTEELGKTAGKDAEQAKLTYPALVGVEESRAVAQRLAARALGALAPLGPRAAELERLCRYLAVRTR